MINTQNAADRTITIDRTFNAPPETVWALWSNPEHLKNWWGPNGFTNTFESFDFRPGGDWRFVMHGPDGKDYANLNRFVEIEAPTRLVIDHLVFPLFRLIVTFEAFDGKTRMLFQQVFDSIETLNTVKPFAIPGGQQTFDRFANYLAEHSA
jgi:uncharacterized protein YndB with AHSA1/START domain